MADTIHLNLVTPERQLIEADVSSLRAVAFEGEVGILPEHANYLALLEVGELSFVLDGETRYVAVTGGFLEVTLEQGIRIMAEAAEFAEEIDVERAQAARERAERRIRDFDPSSQDIDIVRAEAALKRALMRLKVAERAKG